MSYLQASIIVLCAVCACYLGYRVLIDSSMVRRSQKPPSTADLAFDARERLIKALLGDYKAADRLISYEQSIAGPIGCGTLEAVERALNRLERDRSRVN